MMAAEGSRTIVGEPVLKIVESSELGCRLFGFAASLVANGLVKMKLEIASDVMFENAANNTITNEKRDEFKRLRLAMFNGPEYAMLASKRTIVTNFLELNHGRQKLR